MQVLGIRVISLRLGQRSSILALPDSRVATAGPHKSSLLSLYSPFLLAFQILGSSHMCLVDVYKTSQGGTAGPMLGTCACICIMPCMGTLGAPTLRRK